MGYLEKEWNHRDTEDTEKDREKIKYRSKNARVKPVQVLAINRT
jgi:hypothetical protein